MMWNDEENVLQCLPALNTVILCHAGRMRISCDVDIVNRLLPSFNMKKKGKSSRAQLSVGRKPGSGANSGDVFLMMCTKQDRNGAKYQVI